MLLKQQKVWVQHIAQTYIQQQVPELRQAPLNIRILDGPPSAARYAVTAEVCRASSCVRKNADQHPTPSSCDVPDCPLRLSVRMLVDQAGDIVQVMQSSIHWI